jgi:3-(3-hydroxy-phenyl)propionate hydroxylase
VKALPDYTVQLCDPARPMTIVKVGGERRRWEIMLMPGDDPPRLTEPETFWPMMKRWLGPEDATLERAAIYTFHSLVQEGWRKGNLLLAGDACHQTPPFLGQGMCAGIRDASNLIWKLLLVEKAGASRALLRSYQEERKVHVKNVVEQAKDLGLVIGELDLEAANRRDARLRAERTRTGGDPARHRLIPPLSGGLIDCDEHGKPRAAAGTLFPQPTVTAADGRTALMDDVLLPAFLAVSRTIDAQSALSEQAIGMLSRIGAIRVLLRSPDDPTQVVPPDVVVLTAQDLLFANWLAENGAVAAVVRPDRYLYGIARTPADLQPLLDRLSKSLFEGQSGD